VRCRPHRVSGVRNKSLGIDLPHQLTRQEPLQPVQSVFMRRSSQSANALDRRCCQPCTGGVVARVRRSLDSKELRPSWDHAPASIGSRVSRRWFHGIRGLTAMSESLSLKRTAAKVQAACRWRRRRRPCHLSGHPDTNPAGEVAMKVVIATDGRVKEIHVLSGNRILAEGQRFRPYGSGTTLNMH